MSAASEVRPHTVAELGWWAERIAARADSTAWERGFSADFAKWARRPGWRPSPKKEAVMRRMVAERLEGVEVLDPVLDPVVDAH